MLQQPDLIQQLLAGTQQPAISDISQLLQGGQSQNLLGGQAPAIQQNLLAPAPIQGLSPDLLQSQSPEMPAPEQGQPFNLGLLAEKQSLPPLDSGSALRDALLAGGLQLLSGAGDRTLGENLRAGLTTGIGTFAKGTKEQQAAQRQSELFRQLGIDIPSGLKPKEQEKFAEFSLQIDKMKASQPGKGMKDLLDQVSLELKSGQLKQQKKGKILPATQARDLGATEESVDQLDFFYDRTKKLPKRLLTPGLAQLSQLNPFDTSARSITQLEKATKQIIGKGLEGGVLRKEDESKYDKMIPKIGDTAAVLRLKYLDLRQTLQNKYSTGVNVLGKAGFDTSGFPETLKETTLDTPLNQTSLQGIPETLPQPPVAQQTPQDVPSFDTMDEALASGLHETLPIGSIIIIGGQEMRVE